MDRIPIPAGEGERRAQRGYVPQYDLAARVIYEAIASGHLRWIGVADRQAGTFDDIVLGLNDRIRAHQVKTSQTPTSFSIRTLLLGADAVLEKIVVSRKLLRAASPTGTIETVYTCDDTPRTDDEITAGTAISSAAFLRAHDTNRLRWTLADWRGSAYRNFVASLQTRSGLDDTEFGELLQKTQFLVGGRGRSFGFAAQTPNEEKRVKEIAGLLPRLAAAKSNNDRWPLNELLQELGWKDAFSLRHTHNFPVDALYETNAPIEEALQTALSKLTRGYVSLVGPPGSGKSTLLAAGMLPTPKAIVIRYLAYVPGEGQGLGRGEAFDFLHDLIKQLKQQGYGVSLIPGTELPELRHQLQLLIQEASARYVRDETRTIIVVDGLDHVPREERTRHSFLGELPLPQAIPDGVLFVLGTQRIELEEIPPSVRDQATEQERLVEILPLPKEAVTRLAHNAGLPDDVDLNLLFNRSKGHPLSTRYLIEGLFQCTGPSEREKWLITGPTYGGDVNSFYQRAWHDLHNRPDAQRAMAYIALAEGAVHPVGLDALVSHSGTDAAWGAAGHLLVRDRRNAWEIFHNSFRLFLREKTGMRHGLRDEELTRRRYLDLSEMARDTQRDDPQHWMELRYRSRAGDHRSVVDLGTPDYFRSHFLEGRDPGDVRADMDLTIAAAGALRLPGPIFDVLLSRHEINMRVEALGDEVFDAFIAVGDLNAALGLLDASGVAMTVGKGFSLVDALLEAGETKEARDLFQSLEPLDQLLGAAPLSIGHDGELDEWADRALIFRTHTQFLACIDRLRIDDADYFARDVPGQKIRLKLLAAHGQLWRNPALSTAGLLEQLQLENKYLAALSYYAASGAFDGKEDELALGHLNDLALHVDEIDADARRDCAHMACILGEFDLAKRLIEDLVPPSFGDSDNLISSYDFQGPISQIHLHAVIAAWTDRSPCSGRVPKSDILHILQRRLEELGRLEADGRRQRTPHTDPVHFVRSTLDFLAHGADTNAHDSDRWRLDAAMGQVLCAIVDAAWHLGSQTFVRIIEICDQKIEAGRFSDVAIRRAYSEAIFRYQGDADAARLRLGAVSLPARTPGEHITNSANNARALAKFGFIAESRSLLTAMHEEGLGYSRPARKDPQYESWDELLLRANAEDPAGREQRLTFYSKLLSGLAKTEGSNAGQRLVGSYLEEAVRLGPLWSDTAIELVHRENISDWPTIVSSTALGVAKSKPEFSSAAAILIGRLAVPFYGERDDVRFGELVDITPSEQLRFVVEHSISCIEVDAPPEKRILFLEDVLASAAARGLGVGAEKLERWRRELPPPKSGSSPEDPFFLARNLDDIARLLTETSGSLSYGAAKAFAKVAPGADYEAAKALLNSSERLNASERCLEALAHRALELGRRDDALEFLRSLEMIAKEKGSWTSGWRNDAKQRYYRLRVAIEGEVARQAAFDAFVDDLANHREHIDYIFPSLAPIFELMEPRLTWSDAWTRLENHLRFFREYRYGDAFPQLAVSLGGDDAKTLAGLVRRAFTTTVGEIVNLSRVAVIEMANYPAALNVSTLCLRGLWDEGCLAELEAAQYAWEIPDTDMAKEAILPLLVAMRKAEDLAVRQIGDRLAARWNFGPREGLERDLPAFYAIQLPHNPAAERFQAPAGLSLSHPGLFTTDALAWTWGLEQPLRLIERASGIPMSNLRTRVGQLMQRMGGENIFGPEAVRKQRDLMTRLALHLPHRRLMVAAALKATRELLGELSAGNAIDPDAIPYILRHSGATPLGLSTILPVPRPVGVIAANFGDTYRSEEEEKWLAAGDEDLQIPVVEGFYVLASTAVHERTNLRDTSRVELYYGPWCDRQEFSYHEQVSELPAVILTEKSIVTYEGFAQGAVALMDPVVSSRGNLNTLMLCPAVAGALSWRPDSSDLATYRNSSGEVVARTVFWRDGGFRSDDVSRHTSREGYLVVVRSSESKKLAPFLADQMFVGSWRTIEARDNEKARRRSFRVVQTS